MFQGFSDAAIDFMWGVRLNNERGWFAQHKQEYQTYFYRPMQELAQEVFAQVDGACPELGLICKVSRIYRDARRLHGEGPYRDHLWFCIRANSEVWTDRPTFWFELGPEQWSYGLGFWHMPSELLVRSRARLDRDPAQAEALLDELDGQGEFVLTGPSYVRPKAAPTPRLAEWYNKKNFSLEHRQANSAADLYTPALADRLARGMLTLLPFYRYLSTLAGDPDPR